MTPAINPRLASLRSRTLSTSVLGGIVTAVALVATPASATINPDTTTPAAIVDTGNTRPIWVGLGIRNEAGNSGGTCTGLLINPRTVLFAAHCVDGLNPGAYDGDSPGNRARVMYTMDPTFGNANLRQWLFGQDFGNQPGADGRRPDGQSLMLWYDPRSRFGPAWNPNDGTFLPADVAIAGFDSANEILGRDAQFGIGLLFSAVTGQVPVTIGGYGQSGTEPGTTRASDFQRRLGTNVMSFLGTARDINVGFYGAAIGDILSTPTRTYQDMYWADFDDPRRDTRPFFNGPGTRPINQFTLDPDIFPGNATANEVGTAPGDSGSPIVTNAFGRDVSLGVLSQGSRFFFESLGNPNDNAIRTCQNTNVGTNFSCLGTLSGYNPLFLFWDQIVVNNPYKYVTTAAGDGEWTDQTRWRQELDPLFFVLAGSTLVNGLPTTPALGVSGAAPNVGTIRPNPSAPALCAFTGTCPPTGGTSEPLPGTIESPGVVSVGLPGQMDLAGARLNAIEPPAQAIDVGRNEFRITGGDGADFAIADQPVSGAATARTSGVETTIPGTPTETANSTALWTSGTLLQVNSGALTGPGSTNFVPNNTAGTAGLQNSARWFEVNLRAAGTTFVTATDVTIDRLSVRGATSGLNIRSNATLTTVMSSFVDAGMMTVDGRFTARMLTVGGGMLAGTGTVAVRDGLMVTGGVVSPGALNGGVGTLTVTGPATFSGAGMFGVDVASATSADRLNASGRLTLGGSLAVNAVGGYVPLFGTTWTVANGAGGLTGNFGILASNLPGVLRPEVVLSGNDVLLRIAALPFDTFLAGRASPEQIAVGASLNQVRSVAGTTTAANLFAGLDRMDAATLAQTLDLMKPVNALAGNANVRMDNALAATTIFDRLSRTRSGERGQMTVSVNGPSTVMGGSLSSMIGTAVASSLTDGVMAAEARTVSIAPDWSVFAAATYGFGNASLQAGRSSDPSSWTLTFGADRRVDEALIMGAGVSVHSGESDLNVIGNSVESRGWSVNGYAALDLTDTTKLDMWVRAGAGTLDTTRVQAIGNTAFSSAGGADTTTLAWGTTFSHDYALENGVTLSPVLAAVASKTTIDAYTEETGSATLRIDEREVDSLQFKLGLQAAGAWTAGDMSWRPYGRASLVAETSDSPDQVTARFVAGGPNAVPFTITGVTPTGTFGELAGGFTVETSETMSISVEANQTVGRDELELGSLTVSGRIRF